MEGQIEVIVAKREWEAKERRGFNRRTMIGHVPANLYYPHAENTTPLCGGHGEYVRVETSSGTLSWNWIEPCKACFYQVLLTEKKIGEVLE